MGEAAKKGQKSHELIVQRKESKSTRGGTRGFKKGDVATKFTLSLSTAVGGDGARRLGLTLDDANRVVRRRYIPLHFDTWHDELRLGDLVLSYRYITSHTVTPRYR